MNDFPISVLKTEDCCDTQSHRPNLSRVGKANYGPFNIDAVGHLGTHDDGFSTLRSSSPQVAKRAEPSRSVSQLGLPIFFRNRTIFP
jgi:hypothetical protein